MFITDYHIWESWRLWAMISVNCIVAEFIEQKMIIHKQSSTYLVVLPGPYIKTFAGRILLMFVISQSVCLRQKQGQEPIVECSTWKGALFG